MNGDWGGSGRPLTERDYATMRWIIFWLAVFGAAVLWGALS